MRKPLRILITAGPTIEPIDPVRFISNFSTGRMGYQLARLAKKQKYKVTLISGPTNLKPPEGVRFLRIQTARQLCKKVHCELKKSDILIMASAVSDFRPVCFSRNKLKSKKTLRLKLVENPDILQSISAKERKDKIIAGFALETKNLLENATKKMVNKKLDLIIANKIDKDNIPFGRGTKTVYIIARSKEAHRLENAGKTRIARAILDTIKELCYTSN